MPMSFAFGFSDEDVDDGSAPVNTSQEQKAHPLDTTPAVVPQTHTLHALLSSLVNVRFTFDNHSTPANNIVYRRALFDIKYQVMMEDTETSAKGLLLDNASDLQKNIYEGGFKSWECSYDVVDHLAEKLKDGLSIGSFVELGCGSALPSCYLLVHALTKKQKLNMVLTDFNYEVLRLVTVPNLVIHWASTIDPQRLFELSNIDGQPLNNDELLLTPALLDAFEEALKASSIELSFVSGGWARDFLQFVPSVDYIVLSETIYSVETSAVVAEILLELLKTGGTALVAAKNIYFGVGGSVIEFVNYVGDRAKLDVKELEGGLKRSLITMTM